MKKLLLISIVASVLIVSGCSTLKNGSTNSVEGLAKCLSDKGATFYGTERCSHCKDQKAMFGSAMQYVNYVDCDMNKSECSEAGITGYPTWILKDGSKHPGSQPLEKLASLNGCILGTGN